METGQTEGRHIDYHGEINSPQAFGDSLTSEMSRQLRGQEPPDVRFSGRAHITAVLEDFEGQLDRLVSTHKNNNNKNNLIIGNKRSADDAYDDENRKTDPEQQLSKKERNAPVSHDEEYSVCQQRQKSMANEKVAEEALFPAISMPLLSGGRASIPLLSLGFITRKPFEQRIENLRAYKEKHGHVNVKKSDDKSLFTFRRDIRYARKHPEKSNTVLTDDRIASLDALGFEWSMKSNKSFQQRILDLRAYKEKNGHVNVKKSEDMSLNQFCMQMRRTRKNPEKSTMTLTDNRIASLDALGFEWNLNSGIKSIAEQTDRPPSKKRKQKGQGKADTATKKKHVRPKCSAKNEKVVPLLLLIKWKHQ